MLLGYAARNAINPKAQPDHVAQFQKLSVGQGQNLNQKVPGYQQIASHVANRIQTLDPERRELAHQDLNNNLLSHVSSALTSGQTAPAIQAIGNHVMHLGRMYGHPGVNPTPLAPGGPAPVM